MNIDPKMKYKAETGCSPYVNIETSHLTESLDHVLLEGMSAIEIRSMIRYDTKNNAKWGVFQSQLPKEFHNGDDLKIITPEYIEWIENQLINQPK